MNSLNQGFERGHLSAEQTRGIATLILKPNKESTSLNNYRPITLLNTDYKIGAKAIASRLKRVIQNLIGPQQTGFLTNRFIRENIRFVLHLIDHCSRHNISGFLFLVDFEKAFDKLEWNFINSTLTYFQFNDSFKNWVNVFYKNSNACICNNGHSTGFFPIQRGVRQGCPLSPYLFILVAEVLALTIQKNNIIRGITINNREVKIMQYADDTTFFLDGSRESIDGTLRNLDILKVASGLSITISKSSLFPLGPFITRTPRFVNTLYINITQGPVSFLGISFTNDGNDLFRLNYVPKLSRLKNCLNLWSSRDITPTSQ